MFPKAKSEGARGRRGEGATIYIFLRIIAYLRIVSPSPLRPLAPSFFSLNSQLFTGYNSSVKGVCQKDLKIKMRNKVIALFITAAFVLSAAGFVFNSGETAAKGNNELAGLLPASDIVINLDAQRLFNTALPQVLSADAAMLAKINAHIDEIKNKTGLDMRQFQSVSAGIAVKQVSPDKTAFEPFVLARGTFNAGALIAVAKLASNGKYKQKKIGNRTVYIFSLKDAADKNKPNTKNTPAKSGIDKMFDSLSREIALTAYDANTLAIGTEARLREAFEEKTTVSAEVLGLVPQNPNAVITFGGKLQNGLAGIIDLDDDEIGNNIKAIRQMSGALTVENNEAIAALTTKTVKEDQAQALQEMLEGLQLIGASVLRESKNADKQVYVRMIENAAITRNGNAVSFDLKVAQSDIDILLGKR